MSESRIALLIDMDNIIYASENAGLGRFQVTPIIEVLKERGRLIIKRAYADWRRHHDYRYEIQDHAIDLVELPQRGRTNKNSTDIKMVVDAMEIALTLKHVDTFAIVTGDKDFFPLVTKLREHSFQIIGFGVFESTADLLVQNCDEFIYFNNLVKSQRLTSDMDRENIYTLLVSAVKALLRDGQEFVSAIQVKKTILRKNPAFHFGNFGFKSFTGFLRSGARQGHVKLQNHPQTGLLEIGLPKSASPIPEDEPGSADGGEEGQEDYTSVLNSMGLRPWDPEMRRRITRDLKKLASDERDPDNMVLSALIDDLADEYEKANVKIYKSQIRDIVRMLMYVGAFKDRRNRVITSYSTPIAELNLVRATHWINCLCLIHILKYDTGLSRPVDATRLLFGSGRQREELDKLILSLISMNLIKEVKNGSDKTFKVITDRYFLPWK
ncbi:NYN domain-containing protein [bacterium]|nr:NYN domain-containing protein [candidate division CSSED10-310 bacterium]